MSTAPEFSTNVLVVIPVILLVVGLIFGGLLLLLWLGKAIGHLWTPLLVVLGIVGFGVLALAATVFLIRGAPSGPHVSYEPDLEYPPNVRTRRGLVDAHPPISVDDLPEVNVPAEPLPLDADSELSASSKELPEWVRDEPRRVGNVVQMSIDEGPHALETDCVRGLDAKLIEATKDYAEDFIAAGSARLISVSPSYLRDKVVTEEYHQVTLHPFDPGFDEQKMHHYYWLLEFDTEANAYLRKQLKRSVVDSRLWYTGYGLGSLLLALATGFGYLRIDQATAGRYRGRLKLAAGAVILALTATVAWLVRYIALA